MTIDDYELAEFEKVLTVVRAALQNPNHAADIELSTTGHQPSASVKVRAYVLEKFLRNPRL
jgi:hypothetical protein